MRIVLDLQACQSASRYRGIGRYALALAKAMARQCGDHRLLIALNGGIAGTVEPLRAEFEGLVDQRDIRTWLAPMPTAALDARNAWRTRVAEPTREAFLASLAPDVLHLGSLFEGLVDDSVTSIGHDAWLADRTAATFYDLIPLQYPDQYLGDMRVRAWYEGKLAQLRRARLLLAISEHSRREALSLLGVPADAVATISAGVDEVFRPMPIAPERADALRARFGLRGRSVLYAGALDPRKNVPALVSAFARLPAALRQQHQLVIVGNLDDAERQKLAAAGAQAGLGADEMVVTGYVPDGDLVALYNLAHLFVFPSLHEGFGLPALEAMASGLPVIAANRSSLPEAVGREDALFDPERVDAIADKMAHVLGDDGFHAELRRHGLAQASRFTWDACARSAIAAMERVAPPAPPRAVTPMARPRLAVVTPLPPERTGIADYSVSLLPYLARHYEIDVIAGPSEYPRPTAIGALPVHDDAWFARNAHRFDRVLYHFGNSPFHTYMFGLLAEHPGAVVLHDFFYGDLASYLELSRVCDGFWTRALYASHGYPALVHRVGCEQRGDTTARYVYPANAGVLANADGVLVHSRYSRTLATTWYGEHLPQPWHVVPFPRRLADTDARAAARARLGVAPEAFLVCSFGMLGATKCNHRLLAAWRDTLAPDPACRLVFVGENDGGGYGERMRAEVADAASGDVAITGFVSPDTYRDYLDAADVCVQLRTLSRGETSAAVLDALAHGLPTVVNANGSMGEIGEGAALVLPDEFSDAALAEALVHLRSDPGARRELGERARARVAERHAPAFVAERYRDAIEDIARHGPRSALARSVTRIAGAGQGRGAGDADWAALAASVARNQRPVFPSPQLFVDISILVREDLRTGIERVVRGVLLALLQATVPGWRIEPVYADESGVYRYARRFCAGLVGAKAEHLEDAPMEYSAGDLYLALDLAQQNVPRDRVFLQELRDANVRLYFVMYDLLPMRRPDFFPEWLQPVFSAWLEAVTALADGIVCISRAVADELVAELRRLHPPRVRPLRIGSFALGCDLQASLPTRGMSADDTAILRQMAGRTRLLMVGTIEPRKGHAQALDAFEILWAAGNDACLVVVGKPGWMVDGLVARLRGHPEAGQRLFWFEKASDELLEALYRDATALLMASEGEGYGLPLVEAARHDLPILCRDLPVFREVAGPHAVYFAASDGAGLATAITQWLALADRGDAPVSTGIPTTTWRDSAQSLLDVILGQRWHADWMPDGRYWFPANDARLRSEVGALVRARYHSDGHAGLLVTAPGQRFMAGSYRLRVFGRWRQPGGRALLEVIASAGSEPLLRHAFGARDEHAQGLLADVDFVVPGEVADLQLRLGVDEDARLEFDGFEIEDIGGGFAVHAYHSHALPAGVPASRQAASASGGNEASSHMENVG